MKMILERVIKKKKKKIGDNVQNEFWIKLLKINIFNSSSTFLIV